MDGELMNVLPYLPTSLPAANQNPLVRAAINGDVDELASHLNSQKYLNAPDKLGHTVLHVAARDGNLEILDLLLIAPGVNHNAQNNAGDTPLLLSLKLNHRDEIVFHLLQAGCDVNVLNNRHQHPLHLAIQRPSVAVAKYLIAKGVDINIMDNYDCTPLCYAIAANNIEAISMLLYYSVNLELGYMDPKHIDDICPLLSAAYNVNPMVIHMVQLGADVNRITCQMNTIMEYSLFYESADLFKAAWKSFDLHLLFGSESFLEIFLCHCKFGKSDWLECLFMLFQCPIMHKLIKAFENQAVWNYSNLDNTLLRELAYAFLEKNIDADDRVLLINMFLNFGVNITVLKSDINMIMELFGVELELEALVSYPIFCLADFELLQVDHHKDKFKDCDQYYPLSAFLMVAEENYSTGYIVDLFEYQIFYISGIFDHEQFIYPCSSFTNLLKAERRLQCLLDSFTYFSLSTVAKQRICEAAGSPFYGKDKVREKLNEIPEFPSLKELSRNQTRAYLRGGRKDKTASEFYQTVSLLNAPDLIKNQITLRRPVY